MRTIALMFWVQGELLVMIELQQVPHNGMVHRAAKSLYWTIKG